MTNTPGDEELGAAISDPVLANLFSELRSVADQPAPAIGDELAAILAGATPRPASARPTRSQRLVLVTVVSAGALTAGIGAAAATDRLPAPVHRVVAKVVNGVTPFEMSKEPAESEGVNSPTTPAGGDVTSNPAVPVTSDDDEERDHTGAGEDDRSTGDNHDDADHPDADGADYSDRESDDEDEGDSEGDSDSDSDGGDDDSEDDGDSGDDGDSDDGDSEDDGDGSDGEDDGESDD